MFLMIAFTAMLSLVKAQEVSNISDVENEAKAKAWVTSLQLNDVAKENSAIAIVALHLTRIRDWHNSHLASTVPAGINPLTGKLLSELDRQIIADSAIPSTVHKDLMEGLGSVLTKVQIDLILDKYTIGKVAFTMAGYKSIVTDLTITEEAEIQKMLEKAREQAVDYKSMKQISAIFEIYKTQAEQYLNSNGRNWRQMYSDY